MATSSILRATGLFALSVQSACGGADRPGSPSPNTIGLTSVQPAAASVTAPLTAASSASAPPSLFGPRCVRDESFPSPWQTAEASAAAQVELRPGVREILVVGDSGNHGAAMAWSAQSGARSLTLPLDGAASDDLEGMAWLPDPRGGRLYTLTSSGAVRRFAPDGSGGLRRDASAYRIGPAPLSCPDLHDINCGKDWEGLCLHRPRRDAGHARCAGYAASKKETALYCVVDDDRGRLSIDASRPPMRLALRHLPQALQRRLPGGDGVLSDCAFGAPGPADDVLLVTTNIYGASFTYVVDEETGDATPLDLVATPSNEALAVDSSGALYAFMDDNGPQSPAARFVCTGWMR
jgi:hypothetical protein